MRSDTKWTYNSYSKTGLVFQIFPYHDPNSLNSAEINNTDNRFVFTCDVDSAVEQIAGHIFYGADELRNSKYDLEDFALKVLQLL